MRTNIVIDDKLLQASASQPELPNIAASQHTIEADLEADGLRPCPAPGPTGIKHALSALSPPGPGAPSARI
jgi:hypothetical protein